MFFCSVLTEFSLQPCSLHFAIETLSWNFKYTIKALFIFDSAIIVEHIIDFKHKRLFMKLWKYYKSSASY